MSSKALGRVWDLKLSANKLIVLLAYADQADHDGTNIYPSVDKIAWKTGYSSRQVQRVTAELVADGLLIPDGKGPFGTNRFKFDMEAGEKKKPFVPKRKKGTEKGDKLTPESGGDKTSSESGGDRLTPESEGDILSGGGDILASDSGDTITSPKPIEPSFEPSLKEKEEDRPLPPVHTDFDRAIDSYEKNIGRAVSLIQDDIRNLLKIYPVEWLEAAFDEAVRYNRRSLAYCKPILERWQREGKAKVTNTQKFLQYAAATNGNGQHPPPAPKPAYTPPAGLEAEHAAWTAALAQMELQLDRDNFDTWLRDTGFVNALRGVLAADPGTEGLVTRFTIQAKNEYAVLNLQHRLYRTVKRVLRDVYGSPVEIVFIEKQNAPEPAGHLEPAGNLPAR